MCVHNAGRSQMAAALLEARSGGRVRARSAGTQPADAVHPVVVQVMREIGMDLAGRRPTRLTDAAIADADVVVTMGCGDACPIVPGKRYFEWDLPDPATKPLDEVRRIRDEIDRNVSELLQRLRGADLA